MQVKVDEEPTLTEISDGREFLFIFIVDRSGSMTVNNRIVITIEALKLFLRSLPVNSKFSLISFGTKHSFMEINGSTIIEYNNNNVKEAIAQIGSFKPDFGGTNIFDPLKTAQEIQWEG